MEPFSHFQTYRDNYFFWPNNGDGETWFNSTWAEVLRGEKYIEEDG